MRFQPSSMRSAKVSDKTAKEGLTTGVVKFTSRWLTGKSFQILSPVSRHGAVPFVTLRQRDPGTIDGASSQRLTALRNLPSQNLPSHWTADTIQPPRGTKEGAKRCFDIALTLLLGIPTLPLAVIIFIAVRAESSGPILYHAVRVGKNGRLFRCIKFRSMYRDADVRLKHLLDEDPRILQEYEWHHKLQCDPRITAVGRILRRFSLDELPQLWNVLKGDMSLIGPRPYNVVEVPALGANARIIQQVRPGLTGLWQVSGRANTTFAERVALETAYVRHRSFRLDLYILIRTIRAVLSGDGAY